MLSGISYPNLEIIATFFSFYLYFSAHPAYLLYPTNQVPFPKKIKSTRCCMYYTVVNLNPQPGILRNIITTLGRLLLFILIALLTFISVFATVLNPFYYKRVFQNINKKVSGFFPVISDEDVTDNIGGYFSLVIVFVGMVMLLLSLKGC